MANTWTHPRLGVLEQDDIWWRTQIVLPALNTFSYVDAAVRPYKSTPDPFELILQCDSEGEEPSEAMVALAATIVENESQIVPKLLDAIWADLNGLGPNSGMWWHGGRMAAFEQLSELQLPTPTSPATLMAILGPKDLTIRRDFARPKPWVGEFNFHAGFDVEHGVGVLTDGVDVLGIGYSSDATRFAR